MSLANDIINSWRTAEQDVQARPMRQLQGMGQLQGILAQAQKAQMQQQGLMKEQQFRADLQALGPNPDQTQLAQVAAKYAAPADVLKTQQASADRGLQREMVADNRTFQADQQMTLAREKIGAGIEAAKQRGEDQRTLMQMQLAGRKEMAQLAAGMRQPPAPSPVTPVTIQDPNDPSKTIIIDGRTRQKLGDGPKLTQAGGAEQKMALGLPQANLRVRSMNQNLDRLDTAIAELDADPGVSRITGTIMGRTPNITNTATGAQAKLNSVKSQIFQSSLQAMREASKSGGALGQVSDREGDKLERTLSALDQSQGTPDFKAQLKKTREQVKLSKEIINTAFQEQYGGVQSAPAAPSAAPGKPRVVDW